MADPKHYPILNDHKKLFITLIDCKLADSILTCGFAWARGGCRGSFDVTDGTDTISILFPEEASKTQTYWAKASNENQITIRLKK